jgi:hypothetical protein
MECKGAVISKVATAITMGDLQKESYNFETYENALPFYGEGSLQNTIKAMPAGSIWLDISSGKSVALNEGLAMNPGIHGIGVNFRDTAQKSPNTITVKPEASLASNKALSQLQGKVSKISDVDGRFSQGDIPTTLQEYVDLLKPQGEILVNLVIRSNYRYAQKSLKIQDRMFLNNSIINHNSPIQNGITSWMRTIPGIEVVEVRTYKRGYHGLKEQCLAIRIHKLSNQVQIPRNLTTVSYENSFPPIREFRLETSEPSNGK